MTVKIPKFLPKIVITTPKLSFKVKQLKPLKIGAGLICICIAVFGVLHLDKQIQRIQEEKVLVAAPVEELQAETVPVTGEVEVEKVIIAAEEKPIKFEQVKKKKITDLTQPESIKKIEKSDLQNFHYAYLKALGYYKNNMYEKAIAEFKKVVEFGSGDDRFVFSAFVHLGNILDELGRYSDAIYNYSHAIKLKPDNGILYFNRGVIYEHQGDIDNAIEEHGKAIKLDSSLIDAYTALFNLYISLHKRNEASDIINYGIAKNPNNSELIYNFSMIDLLMKNYDDAFIKLKSALEVCKSNDLKIKILDQLANVSEIRKDYKKVITFLKQILQINPDDIKSRENLGFTYISQNDYNSAILVFQKLNKLKPNDYKYPLLIGNIYFDNNDLTNGERYFKIAERLGPERYSVQYSLGNIFMKRGYKGRAFKYYKKTIQFALQTKYPESFDDLNNLLYNTYLKIVPILIEKQAYNTAIEIYNNALKLKPQTFINYNLGILHEKLKEYDKALAMYSKAIDENYQSYDYNKAHGTLLFKLRRFDSSQKYLNIALKSQPKDYEILFMIGYNFYHDGKLEKAYNYFVNVLKNKPSKVILVATYKNIGNVLNIMNKSKEAIYNYSRGIELSPKDGILYYNAAIAYTNLKEYSRAIQYLKVALKYVPKDARIYTALGNCYFEKGLPGLAEKEFAKALALDNKNIEIQYNLKLARDIQNQ